MPDQSRILHHHERDIVYADYTSLENAEDLRRRIRKVERLEKELGPGGILEIVDVTGSYADAEMLDALMASAEKTAGNLGKVAVVGVSEVKEALLTVVNEQSGLHAESKATMNEALEWLTRD